MLPTGLAGLEAQLWVFLVAMIRPGAAFLAAPVFGAQNVPVQVRLIISLAVGIPAIQQVPFDLPADGIVTVMGFMLVAGEVIGNAMGLGFAQMVDPQSGASSTALGQFLSILGTFLFLAMNGHLALATIIVDSYHSLPPGQAWLGQGQMRDVIMFGGDMFAAGMAIALPVGFALILVQVVMAMLARSAPAMNLFSVGLPATILAGVVLMAIAAPALGDGIATAIERGLDLSRALASAKGG